MSEDTRNEIAKKLTYLENLIETHVESQQVSQEALRVLNEVKERVGEST